MQDHGGNLDWAIQHYGGAASKWVDLSTGINPMPYPVDRIPQRAWTDLPQSKDIDRLLSAARAAYGTEAEVIAFSGAQSAIQTLPFLKAPGTAAILGPTYNEFRAALETGNWSVCEAVSVRDLRGAEMAVVVNPNNPDGRVLDTRDLRDVAGAVGTLIVDESFADATPGARWSDFPENTVILRSFGKFYGLAGVRLGFALAHGENARRLRDLAGPWAVSGPAIALACRALRDSVWQGETIARCRRDAARLDRLAGRVGWTLVGGTALFRTYETTDAEAAQRELAQSRVWSRIFPYSKTWIRLGLPPQERWDDLEAALAGHGE